MSAALALTEPAPPHEKILEELLSLWRETGTRNICPKCEVTTLGRVDVPDEGEVIACTTCLGHLGLIVH